MVIESLLNDEKVENFNKHLSEFWEFIEAECEENPEVMFSLYVVLKEARGWDDETLCKNLSIREKAIEEIKGRHKPRSEGVGLKMLYELFPQMAV